MLGKSLGQQQQQLNRSRAGEKIYEKILSQWRDLQAAKSGSFKHWLYRLAQGVRSKEEPEESFLKGVPSQPEHIDIIYPSGVNPKYVRRRMKTLLKQQRSRLRMRMAIWSLACIPLIPLLATPVPNLPLYYAGYKVYSARTALVGCNALTNMWSHLDTEQLTKLREKLRELQDSGVVFPEDAWTGKLLRPHPRYLDILENIEGRVQRYYFKREPRQLIPKMVPNDSLNSIVRSQDRTHKPITDEEALAIGKEFDAQSLFEHVARARRRVVGAMFPTDIS
ncbi:hypothetical protein WJX75_009840 [Coccomyxa subellipsoidea]|uniref:Uncharacterized protein n=1 Tax=Coccomyxa subellipsoidea TaxID=248742 RepID=A0ABR2YSP6_9CHLO